VLKYSFAVYSSNAESGALKQILSTDYWQVLTRLWCLVLYIIHYRKLKFRCLGSPILHPRAMRKGLLMLLIQKATWASIYSSTKKQGQQSSLQTCKQSDASSETVRN